MAEPTVANHPARELGRGWKVAPYVNIKAGTTYELANIQGPGAIQQMWMTPTGNWRFSIIRIYWDDSPTPSVECPVGDFFACGWGKYAPVSSLAVCVNPGSAFNCYWPMPFRKRCRITLENIAGDEMRLYYQINYALHDVPEDAAYFHAQFRRVNPVPYKEVYTILDNVSGWGQYVGTYMCWGVNNSGWWGEGEIKFYMDGDTDYPTLCGTGTEDYFCGSYNFENQATKQYQEFTTPYAGLCQVIRPDGVYQSQTRFGMYRWHIMDPVRFEKDLRVTIQALGGAAMGDSCRCRMIFLRWRIGIRRCRSMRFRNCLRRIIWKSFDFSVLNRQIITRRRGRKNAGSHRSATESATKSGRKA